MLRSRRNLVLASSSPRRKDILGSVFSDFLIDPPKGAEASIVDGRDVGEQVLSLARAKAQEVAPRHADALVIGCDTSVLSTHVLGKPKDKDEARQMLGELSGRAHTVLSGLWVIDTKSGAKRGEIVTTKVFFDALLPEDIELLLESGEYEGKAGAYAIQGLSGLFIRGIDGDYNNVVGLPMQVLYGILKEMGA